MVSINMVHWFRWMGPLYETGGAIVSWEKELPVNFYLVVQEIYIRLASIPGKLGGAGGLKQSIQAKQPY